MKNDSQISRRSIVRGIAGSSIFGGIGIVGASDRSTSEDHKRYIVLGGETSLEQRLKRTSFDVLHMLADGAVFIVEGPKANQDELEAISAITDTVVDESYAADGIEQSEDETVAYDDEPLSDKQWDKQLVQATAAHEQATGEGTTIAIIDSGISFDHPDL